MCVGLSLRLTNLHLHQPVHQDGPHLRAEARLLVHVVAQDKLLLEGGQTLEGGACGGCGGGEVEDKDVAAGRVRPLTSLSFR